MMNEVDKYIKEVLSKEVTKPQSYYNTIKYALNTEEMKKINKYFIINNFKKTAIAILSGIFLTSGFVFAAKIAYQKIWQEPEKVENYYIDNKIADDELECIITKEEAIEFAKELLKRFNYESESIERIELTNSATNYNLQWHIETENKIKIFINAKDKNTYSIFTEMIFINQNIKDYRGTEEEMVSEARKICEEQGYDLSEYNNIDVTYNGLDETDSYIWYVNFNNKYNGQVNKYVKNIFVGILPEINAPYWFIVNDCEFDNNPIEITEEEARKIAIAEDNTIEHGYNVVDVKSNLDIAMMNGDEYLRKKDYNQYYMQTNTENYNIEDIIYYRTENTIRNCWMVTVIYDCNENQIDNRQYTYFVDATTGEIIGGNLRYMFN